ncbi:MAG: Rpn family recombination-promoting nuclease/putative transposase [Acidobacteriota bacterium]|nr:Rpn family recombination-promoting nuclease/putative transposase [Acidobacteriota bacterium]
MSAEYVSDALLKRHGDAVWRVRQRGRWVYLMVLLEFQSRDEPRMALRILTYTGLLYEELVRNRAVAAGEPLPAVLPVVLYNGARPWRAAREMGELIAAVGPELAPYQPAQRYHVVDERHLAEDDLPSGNLMTSVVQLERIGAAPDLVRVVEALQAKLSDPRETGLHRAFLDWVRQLAERLAPSGGKLPPVQTLEELKMTLVERVAEWPKQWLREGIEQGVKQGLAQQRALLRRQAALRFGAETASRVSRAVERIADPEGLAAAGDWIVRADTGDELVARLMQLAEGRNTP